MSYDTETQRSRFLDTISLCTSNLTSEPPCVLDAAATILRRGKQNKTSVPETLSIAPTFSSSTLLPSYHMTWPIYCLPTFGRETGVIYATYYTNQ